MELRWNGGIRIVHFWNYLLRELSPHPLAFEKKALVALRNQLPVRDLPGVRIRAVKAQPEDAFDVQFELESGTSRVRVLGEFKSSVSLSKTLPHGSAA